MYQYNRQYNLITLMQLLYLIGKKHVHLQCILCCIVSCNSHYSSKTKGRFIIYGWRGGGGVK